jgi:hypothetical protein
MSNKVLCQCFICKKNDKNNIGKYVHPTTKWRHGKKAKPKNNLSDLTDDEVEFDRLYY